MTDHTVDANEMVRAEFEAYWKMHLGLSKEPAKFDDGSYKNPPADIAFRAWQAATKRQQERISYVEKVADDAIELGNQQAKRIAELEAQVQALSLDADRYQFATSHNAEGRLNFGVIYDAWDGDGSFTDQIDAAMAGKGTA